MNTVFKHVIGLDLNSYANFVSLQSAVLEKMMLEVAIFGYFWDISQTEIVTSTLSYRGAGCDVE